MGSVNAVSSISVSNEFTAKVDRELKVYFGAEIEAD